MGVARSAAAALLVISGCSSLYYSSMKKLGREKRDILVSRIEDGKEAQQEAAREIKTAFEAFQEVTNFKGGDLEQAYKKLNKEFEDVESRAKKVHDRVNSIEKVASDLFLEWEQEVAKMSNGRLKEESRTLLAGARDRHRKLMRQMRASEAKMKPVINIPPVLSVFNDQVLYLKHNLNARAMQSLRKQVVEIDDDVAALIKEVELTTQEADRTIAGLANAAE